MTVRISDPRPAFCSACHNSPAGRFVDFDSAFDSGAFVDRETQAYIEGSDDLHLCEPCVKLATEVLGLKAELNTRQLREIRRLEGKAEYWEAYAKRLEATLQGRPEPAPRATGRKAVAA